MTVFTAYSSANCDESHQDHIDNIWSGYSGRFNESFGGFIAQQPVGAEIISISGRLCRWTGRYTKSNGHHAAVLQVIDRPELGEITIHCCGDCKWSATGRIVTEDGTRSERRFDIWPESLGEKRIREARESVAKLRAEANAN